MISLKVDSAYPEDQGGGRARLDPETMLHLHLSPGDLIYIDGKNRTVAKVWRMMVNDWNQEKVRIDNFTRMNAGVSIGDKVDITPVENIVAAESVILAPPEDLPKQLPINYNSAIARLIDFPILKNDSVPVIAGLPFMQPQTVSFKVVYIEPENAVIINRDTEIEFSDKPAAGFEGLKTISYEDIGGLKGELQNVRETIELPMRHPELFRKLGIEPPKGVLLYGPPGTGKTLIAKAVANESGAHFISIAGPEIISKYYGESEQRLREIFDEAEENAPSIVFIDELDSIAPKREDVTGEVERRVVAQLLTMMDGLEERGQVVVIGATNRLDAIDQALRRPGRFDREIEIGVPGEDDRLEILRIHTRGMPIEGENLILEKKKECDSSEGEAREKLEEEFKIIADEVHKNRETMLEEFASKTNGFVGADLASLAREAAMRALRRYLPDIDLDSDEIPQEVLESMEIRISDFRDALKEINPSAMREVFLEVSHVNWSDVGGLSREKEEIRETVEYPLTRREKFENFGIKSPKGVLLYGPPGTGKTLIAKAVANESGANFIPVRGPQLLSKWVGESERAVREIFRKARQVAPSIIFFDELDALAPARGSGPESRVVESVLNQILTEFDGIEELNGVVVMGATNRPDIIDPALLRAGRFDRLVYIGEPDEKSRVKIIQIHSKYLPLEDSNIEEAVDFTQNYDESSIEEAFSEISKKRDFSLNRKLTVDELKAGFEGIDPRDSPVLSKGNRRRIIVAQLIKNGLYMEDPVRDSLIKKVAAKTFGYVGSDLELLCRESAMFAMREGKSEVLESHFKMALEKIHPMMNDRLREQYSKIEQHFKGGLPQQVQPVEYQ
ncbi:transitional endoplasmic reticulum ATPase [Methanomicrobium sp. W14]|uniref:CDC48 family AAA ATPase n=1 Tax=Methanomicrobium sp. W14 TaxID=2817839 RepID=UPI001AE73A11|nr:CDC48 family AAA ATPase [Methanomicrobium sp. W14]MBP2132906.1 transitional endoplasmic reticulum ATPase [Methanomicrobium sp. W14]